MLHTQVAELRPLHLHEKVKLARLTHRHRLVQEQPLELIEKARVLRALVGEVELEEGDGLFMHFIVVPLRNELTDLEDLSPLLEDGEELLAPAIDLAAVVLEDIGLLDISQVILLLVLVVVENQLQLLEVVSVVQDLLVFQLSLFDDFVGSGGSCVVDLQVPAHLLHLPLQNRVGLQGRVEANRPLILARGLVEVEIDAGVVDLLLDPVPFGEVEEVLGRNGKKKVDVFFSLLLIVQHKRAQLKAANLLEDVDDGIELHCE